LFLQRHNQCADKSCTQASGKISLSPKYKFAKFMYDQYFNKEYTYLHKLTGLQKLPHLPLPWCFKMAVKKVSRQNIQRIWPHSYQSQINKIAL